MRLAGFESVTFQNIVNASKNERLIISPKVIIRTEHGAVYDVDVKRESDGAVTTKIEGMHIEYRLNEHKRLLEDQMLEGAAQAMGVSHLKVLNDETMPLFLGIGRTYFDGEVGQGDGIVYDVSTKQIDKRKFGASVIIKKDDKIICKSEDLSAMVVNKSLIPRLLG